VCVIPQSEDGSTIVVVVCAVGMAAFGAGTGGLW
jgi:hypothetical protein